MFCLQIAQFQVDYIAIYKFVWQIEQVTSSHQLKNELHVLPGYSKWENFEKVIHKAKDACRNAGELIENHFPDIRKMVEIGSKTERPVDDIALTRYNQSSGIRQYENKELHLPGDEEFYSSVKSLSKHRGRFGWVV
jgi:hypothetical protein